MDDDISVWVPFVLILAVVQLIATEYVVHGRLTTIEDSLSLNPNRCHHPLITQLNLEQTVVKSFSFLLNHKTSTQNLIPLLYYYFLTWLGWQSFWRVTVVITNFVFSNDVDVSCETAHFSLFTFVWIMQFGRVVEYWNYCWILKCLYTFFVFWWI